jgi:formate hydrogenlyase subunit 3/multisubunit Na+/H+ antiporter MnhD subunit
VALAAVGALALAGVEATPLEWWPGLPGDPFRLAPDALAAPFLLLLGVLGVLSFGSASYAHAPATIGRRATFALHAGFALALAATFAATHALLFLIAWEGMTLLSAALVAHDTRSARARSAVWVYRALSHVGTALMAFGLMRLVAISGSFGFADLAGALALLPSHEGHVAVWLMSAGFAVKLGLVPFHVWLPLAHPEAPGPVSALLSGVMVKAGLYGLLRFGWAIPGARRRAGARRRLLGMITALVGALYAVVQATRSAARLLTISAGLMSLSLGSPRR